ncbi:hypothetical protein HYX18_04470 [Candidatus Woesearchaeota archaeon]|nr:hypothetical protein [Candidatus Woesearchaeota archaeon]
MEPTNKKEKISEYTGYVFIGIVAVVIIFNQIQISALTGNQLFTTGAATSSIKLSANADVNEIINKLIPKGTPEVYGNELGISYDDPVKSLSKLAALDRVVQDSSLTSEEKSRYINIGTKISCEFCCSAPAVIDSQGRSLCGCSHAASFKGLAKYLVKNHPEMSDEQILWELTKWKSIYYPKNMVEKAVLANQNGLELSPDVLNDRALIQKLKSGQKSSVGDINSADLPEMVGGC